MLVLLVADRVDAVVEVTTAAVSGSGDFADSVTASGDPSAFAQLVGFLDLDATGYFVHQRWQRKGRRGSPG
ncbi:MAG: hypothetical protein M3132_02890 [Actinomycetia bacterium]|nr:hypothetical protein [Actinomycetes bacterium]